MSTSLSHSHFYRSKWLFLPCRQGLREAEGDRQGNVNKVQAELLHHTQQDTHQQTDACTCIEWMISSPAAQMLNRQISNTPEEMGALQLYSPANSRAKSVKVTVLLPLDPGATVATWQLHSSNVSALSSLIAVVSRYQSSENGGLDTWKQVSIAPPPSRINSGMSGPTSGWMVNSVVQINECVKRKKGKEIEREREK